jgi:glycosyltransferase involved in cell wall biosynthesis
MKLSMANPNVLFLRGFKEIEPASTAIIADGLLRSLQKYAATEIVGNVFTPKMLLPSWLKGVWPTRFARFFLYPLQVPHQTEIVTHLLDYSYAHILYFHKPDQTIVTVTDLMPVLWWKGLLPVKTKKSIPVTVLYSLYALKRAAHIIAISSNTKNDLVRLIGCDPSKISVVYLGVDEIFRPYDISVKNSLRNQLFGREPKKIILITGSQFYKNHETALKTVSSLLANGMNDIYLVKTGNPSRVWLDLVKKYELERNVINVGFVPRAQLPDLFNAVDILLFPSLYEGFGWPPLEAMACGTPAVTSNVASLPEVMGNINTMCDPFDSDGFAQKIQTLFIDTEHRQRIIRQGIDQSAKFNWDNTAREVISIYKGITK